VVTKEFGKRGEKEEREKNAIRGGGEKIVRNEAGKKISPKGAISETPNGLEEG